MLYLVIYGYLLLYQLDQSHILADLSATLRAIPTRRLWQDRRYNRLAIADYGNDYSAGDPVGMAYLLGNWATESGRPLSPDNGETADLYQACLIFHR